MNAPTFKCSWCGAPIQGQSPGTVMNCPYCQARVTVPYPGADIPPSNPQAGGGGGVVLGPGVVIHGNVQIGGGRIVIGGGGGGEGTDPNLSTHSWNVLPAVDPQIGPVAYGPHAPDGQPARLRALSLRDKRVLWEALSGERLLDDLDNQHMALHGPNLYVAWKRQLMALDRATGTKKWAVGLPDEVETYWGDGGGPQRLAIADAFPIGQRGAILVATIDHVVLSIDRDTGHVLWKRQLEHRPKFRVGDGLSIVGILDDATWSKLEIVNPAYAQPIASLGPTEEHWNTGVAYAKVFGRTVVCHADSWPINADDDHDGCLLIDLPTGRIHFFEPIESVENSDVPPALIGQRVFCCGSSGENYWVGPRGGVFNPPLPGHRIVALEPAGPVLAVMMTKSAGSSLRRIVGIDPNSLQLRWDTGELSTEPSDGYPFQVQSNGYTLAYVNAKHDDGDDCEIVCVDTTTGRILFKKDIGEWQSHAYDGALLVVRSRGTLWYFLPQTGEIVGQFPAAS